MNAAFTLNINEELNFINIFLKFNLKKPVNVPNKFSFFLFSIQAFALIIKPIFKIAKFEELFFNWYIEKLDHYTSIQSMYYNTIPNFSQGHCYNEYYNLEKYKNFFDNSEKEIEKIESEDERIIYIKEKLKEIFLNLSNIKHRLALYTHNEIRDDIHFFKNSYYNLINLKKEDFEKMTKDLENPPRYNATLTKYLNL